MKITVYYLTSDLSNSGTDTHLFSTQEALETRMQTLILASIDFADIEWDAEQETAVTQIRTHLEANEVWEAWELFNDYDGTGCALHDDGDCYLHGEQELEFPAVDALLEAAFAVERRTGRITYPDGATGKRDTVPTVPEDALADLKKAAADLAVPE